MKLLITLGQAAFAWTWETSLYASLLIVLVFGLQKVLARWLTPRLRYTISLLVLLRLLLPMTPFSALSVGNLLPPGARLAQPASFPLLASPATTGTATAQSSRSAVTAAPAVSEPLRITISGALGLAWAAGGLSLLMLAGWRLRRWNRLIQKGRRISESRLVGLLESARETMKVRRPVQLVAVPELNSPAVFGIFQTRLLLPESTLRQLDDGELFGAAESLEHQDALLGGRCHGFSLWSMPRISTGTPALASVDASAGAGECEAEFTSTPPTPRRCA